VAVLFCPRFICLCIDIFFDKFLIFAAMAEQAIARFAQFVSLNPVNHFVQLRSLVSKGAFIRAFFWQ
jgi:hypothetical protein